MNSFLYFYYYKHVVLRGLKKDAMLELLHKELRLCPGDIINTRLWKCRRIIILLIQGYGSVDVLLYY